MSVREQQDSVDVEHYNRGGFVQMLAVVPHPVRIQMWTTAFNRILRQIRNPKIHSGHEVSLSDHPNRSQNCPPPGSGLGVETGGANSGCYFGSTASGG